jgi:hypothetical protein
MKIAELIRNRIEQIPLGEPFAPTMFLELGSRAIVDQTLSRLIKAGQIVRVTRGVFVRPKKSRYVGNVMPEPFKLAETFAKGETVQVHGAEAARQLELTTQMPTQPVFYTSGRSKRLRVGKIEIRLLHASSRKLALAGRPAGLALSALWYLGKHEVTENIIDKIHKKLPPAEFEALRSAVPLMPAWMAETLLRYERTHHG